jgi:hypothetical protein
MVECGVQMCKDPQYKHRCSRCVFDRQNVTTRKGGGGGHCLIQIYSFNSDGFLTTQEKYYCCHNHVRRSMNYSIPKQNEEGHCVHAYSRHPTSSGHNDDSPSSFLWFSSRPGTHYDHFQTIYRSVMTIFHAITLRLKNLTNGINEITSYPPPNNKVHIHLSNFCST